MGTIKSNTHRCEGRILHSEDQQMTLCSVAMTAAEIIDLSLDGSTFFSMGAFEGWPLCAQGKTIYIVAMEMLKFSNMRSWRQ